MSKVYGMDRSLIPGCMGYSQWFDFALFEFALCKCRVGEQELPIPPIAWFLKARPQSFAAQLTHTWPRQARPLQLLLSGVCSIRVAKASKCCPSGNSVSFWSPLEPRKSPRQTIRKPRTLRNLYISVQVLFLPFTFCFRLALQC